MKRTKRLMSIALAVVLMVSFLPMGKVSVAASSFIPRLTAPERTGYYSHNTSTNPYSVNSIGGNCTWYAWGRAYEILGSRPQINTIGNACTWYPNNQSSGAYAYGSTPKLGAIACWSGGSSGMGHVAVVEQIKEDGTVVISESSWSATTWWFRTNTVNYYRNSLTFQGYIYIGDFDPLEVFSEPPTPPTVTVDQKIVLSNDDVTITFSAERVHSYWVGIYKDDVLFNDYRVYGDSLTVSYPWVGKYDIAVSASNNCGSTGGYASFYVGKEGDYVPENVTAYCNKTTAMKNETVTISFSADYATSYWVGIYHNDEWILRDNYTIHSFTVNYSDPGEYSVAIVAMNPCSSADTKYLKFTVLDMESPPASPTVTVEKCVNIINEPITISFDAFGAEDYWVGIYKDNVLFNDYATSEKQITVDYPWVGKYDIAVVARNGHGSTGGYASFYVGNEGDYVPINFSAKSNKSLVLKNEAVTISFSADYATAYWIGVYHNNEWVLRENYTTNSIAVNYSDSGEYSVAIVAMNPCASSETKYVKFTVVEQKTFAIQYDANGGFGAPSPHSKEYNQSIVLSLQIPQKPGFSFLEWNTRTDGSGTSYTAGSRYKDNENLLIYAQWTANDYAIKLDPDSGVCGIKQITVFYNEPYGVLPVPTRERYTFIGWFLADGTAVTESTVVTTAEDHTLYAHWEALPQITVPDGAPTVIDEESGYIYGLRLAPTERNLEPYLSTKGGAALEYKTGGYIGTGTKVDVLDETGGVVQTYTIVIFGDTDGDGAVTQSDIAVLKAHMNGAEELPPDDPRLLAGDLDGDGAITQMDTAIMKGMMNGAIELDQATRKST